MWRATEVVLLEARRDKKKKVHFATWMDICHPKNVEFEPQFEKYEGRIVLRGDTKRWPCRKKVMDVIASLPECDGQPADAASG